MAWHQDDTDPEGAQRPSSPERLLLDLLARLQRDADELRDLVEELPLRTAAWRASYAKDTVDVTVDRIGADGASWFAWWGYLLEQGRHPTYAIVSNLDAIDGIEGLAPGHLDRLGQSLASGELSLRLIVPLGADRGAAGEVIAGLAGAGVELRVGDVSDWFAVTPNRAALLPARWGLDRDVDALVVHTPGIVAALEQLFLLRWSQARPWNERRDPAIELLCAGRTDDQIAEKLGISVRSVRRRVAAHMQRTGAATRTQLGYLLAREHAGSAHDDGGRSQALQHLVAD